jgi:hypothetical protein
MGSGVGEAAGGPARCHSEIFELFK